MCLTDCSCALGLFFYQTMDVIDGKQARRTGTSSPLGELFDHGSVLPLPSHDPNSPPGPELIPVHHIPQARHAQHPAVWVDSSVCDVTRPLAVHTAVYPGWVLVHVSLHLGGVPHRHSLPRLDQRTS